jgi:hypothetical protein
VVSLDNCGVSLRYKNSLKNSNYTNSIKESSFININKNRMFHYQFKLGGIVFFSCFEDKSTTQAECFSFIPDTYKNEASISKISKKQLLDETGILDLRNISTSVICKTLDGKNSFYSYVIGNKTHIWYMTTSENGQKPYFGVNFEENMLNAVQFNSIAPSKSNAIVDSAGDR